MAVFAKRIRPEPAPPKLTGVQVFIIDTQPASLPRCLESITKAFKGMRTQVIICTEDTLNQQITANKDPENFPWYMSVQSSDVVMPEVRYLMSEATKLQASKALGWYALFDDIFDKAPLLGMPSQTDCIQVGISNHLFSGSVIEVDVYPIIHRYKRVRPLLYQETKVELQEPYYHLNPGLTYWTNKLLLAYRQDCLLPNTKDTNPNWLYRDNNVVICELDEQFRRIGEGKKLDLPKIFNTPETKHEDARLFIHRDVLYCSYSNCSLKYMMKRPFAAVGLSQLTDNLDVHKSWWPAIGGNLTEAGDPLTEPVEAVLGSEKNWIFFSHDGELYVYYSLDPGEVYRYDLKKEQAWLVNKNQLKIPWRYGKMRGGTNVTRVGNEYFGFFHSSFRYPDRAIFPHPIYTMGFFAFEAKPPFRLTRISKEPLSIGPLYESTPTTIVVFPTGAILNDGKWLVSCGINDYRIVMQRYEHEVLLRNCLTIK